MHVIIVVTGHDASDCKIETIDLTKNDVESKLYVLKLEHDCYYIGVSSYLNQKLEDQFNGKGAMWLKKHKPLELVDILMI